MSHAACTPDAAHSPHAAAGPLDEHGGTAARVHHAGARAQDARYPAAAPPPTMSAAAPAAGPLNQSGGTAARVHHAGARAQDARGPAATGHATERTVLAGNNVYPVMFVVRGDFEGSVLKRAIDLGMGHDSMAVDIAPTVTPLPDGLRLFSYALELRTNDIYNLNRQLGGKVVQPTLHRDWSLEFPLALPPLEGRKQRLTDGPLKLFECPFASVTMRRVRPQDRPGHAEAIAEARKRFGSHAAPQYDPFTGLLCAYTRPGLPDITPFDGQWRTLAVEPYHAKSALEPSQVTRLQPERCNTLDEAGRDALFPGWRTLMVALKERLVGLVNVLHVSTGSPKLAPGHVAALAQNPGILCIKGPCASGKTVGLEQAVTAILQKRPNTSFLVYSTRRSFARHAERVFSELEFRNYQSSTGMIFYKKSIVSLESLQRVGYAPDVVIMDEGPELMQQMLAETVRDKITVFNLWTDQIRGARTVILASDDLDDKTLGFVRRVRKDGNDRVAFYLHTYDTARGKVAFVSVLEDTIRKLMDELGMGHRAVVSCASKELAYKLQERVRREQADKRVYLCTGDSGDEDVARLTKDPEFLRGFDLFIYTSVIGTGVSIDIENHFNVVFQFADPRQRLNLLKQALFRARNISSRTYYIHVLPLYGASPVALTPAQVREDYEHAGRLDLVLPDGGDATEWARFAAEPRDELDALFLDLVIEDKAACSVDQADFEQRYMRHLVHDCGLEFFEADVYPRAMDLTCQAELVKALQGRLDRKRVLSETMAGVRFDGTEAPEQWRFTSKNSLDKKVRSNEATVAHKVAKTAGYHHTVMYAPSLTADVHRDLDLQGFVQAMLTVENATFKSVSERQAPGTTEANRALGIRALLSLMWILGFPPSRTLLDTQGVRFHAKMRLSEPVQAWLRSNWDVFLTLTGWRHQPDKLEGRLFGHGELKACLCASDMEIAFNPADPLAFCPRIVVLQLADKLLEKYTKLKLVRTDQVKNMRINMLPAVLLPPREHHAMTHERWRNDVVARATRTDDVNVYMLRIGPFDLQARYVELLHDRAVNREDADVETALKSAALERKKKSAKQASVPLAMRGSYVDAADVQRRARLIAESEAEQKALKLALRGAKDSV